MISGPARTWWFVGTTLKLKPESYLQLSNGAIVSVKVVASDSGSPVATLSQTLIVAVQANPQPWRNATNARDVDGDIHVTPLDALIIINKLNSLPPDDPSGSLPPARPSDGSYYYDVNGDSFVSPLDVLLIINHLNAYGSGEGEAAASAWTQLDAEVQPAVPPQATSPDHSGPLDRCGLMYTIESQYPQYRMASPRPAFEMPAFHRRQTLRLEPLHGVGTLDETLDELAADIATARRQCG